MITIVDYGCGNVNAFVNAFKRLNIASIVATNKQDIYNASTIILPGVGAFDHVMSSFNKSGFRDVVEKKVLIEKVPVLGVCAGMQIMANGSEEGSEKGLGWINGYVKLFDTDKINYKTKLPHMGWNEITPQKNALFSGISSGSRFYFVHSFYFEPANKQSTIATTFYGFEFASAINNENIYGVQFHPEKSHENGQKLLKNFTNI